MIEPQSTYARPSSVRVPVPRETGEQWRRYWVAGLGSLEEEEIVKTYLPLVKTVVGRLAMSLPPHLDTDDLRSVGMLGLLNAVRHYNPQIGTVFEAYARLRIRGAVLDELRRMNWVPRSVQTKARKVQAALAQLEQAKGRMPTDLEMAQTLHLSVRQYQHWQAEIRPAAFVCLDAVSTGEGEDDLCEHELRSDDSQGDVAEAAARADLVALIAERVTQLPALHQKVMALYYQEDFRLREIAMICGLCDSRISQIHTQSILAIQSCLQSRMRVA